MLLADTYLDIDSTLAEIPSFNSILSVQALGSDVASLFQQNLLLPGVIIVDQQKIVGVIPRKKFFENIGRPFGVEVYMCRKIELLLDNISINPLIFQSDTRIIEAAQFALSRQYESVYEPVVVQFSEEDYRIVDVYSLLTAQSRILKKMNETIIKQKEMMESLNDATNSLVSTLELNSLCEKILTAVLSTLAMADKGAVYMYDEQNHTYRICAYQGYQHHECVDDIYSASSSHNLCSVLGNNVNQSTYFQKTIQNNGIRNHIDEQSTSVVYPFVEEQKIFGGLILEKISQKGFTDEELKLLSIFSAAASTAIQNAKLHEEMKQLAITDALTGLLNRRGLYQIAILEIERANRYNRHLSLLMIDIDHFKNINDKYGHESGDLVISTMGKICRENSRSTDICCRFGGEEFVLLLPETEIHSALQFARRLCQLAANTIVNTTEHTIKFTISIGVAQLQPDHNIDQLIDCADKAMYAAKVLGRNRVVSWEDVRSTSGDQYLLTEFHPFDNHDMNYALEQVSATLQQKEAEFRILESAFQMNEAKLAAILQGAAEAILSINKYGKIIMFNDAAERIFKYSTNEILGAHISNILPYYNQFQLRDDIVGFQFTENKKSQEMIAITKQGQEIIVEVSSSVLFENGQTITTMIINDITDKKEQQRKIQEAHIALTNAYDETIKGWARTLELRDLETFGHSNRVVDTTIKMARALSLSEEEINHIRRGALLHDIGKMGIPDKILLKPGPLSDEEWEIMKQHPIFGYELLYPISFLRPSLDIVLFHHEKWDGTGYPEGLCGNNIPLAARIFALSDVWDALRNKRRYSPAWDDQSAMNFILQNAGKHFDPDLVSLFFEVIINQHDPIVLNNNNK